MKKYCYFIVFILYLLAFTSCKQKQVGIKSTSTTRITSEIKNNPSTDSIIVPYKQKLENEMSEVLIFSESEFTKSIPEGTLGNLVADIAFLVANKSMQVDFCLLNNGGLRTSLPEGNITKGKIFELMPFENELVIVTLSAAKIKELFNYVANKGGQPLAGITMKIRNNKAEEMLINNEPINNNKIYKVVTTDYLANGGDNMIFFSNPISMHSLNIKLRDAIIFFLKEKNNKNEKLRAYTDNRITIE
jgi:2',3'-cyclic-nucleotide 2'-phosphodiesterase (5'-nucleotidase family)